MDNCRLCPSICMASSSSPTGAFVHNRTMCHRSHNSTRESRRIQTAGCPTHRDSVEPGKMIIARWRVVDPRFSGSDFKGLFGLEAEVGTFQFAFQTFNPPCAQPSNRGPHTRQSPANDSRWPLCCGTGSHVTGIRNYPA